MQPKRIRPDIDREFEIQNRIIARLKVLGWFAKKTHGNEFQCGFPDVFAAHVRFGSRWIETKRPDYQSFTKAQLHDFPLFSDNGSGIWVLTGADEDEIRKLFLYQNWWTYLQIMRRNAKYRATAPKEAKPSRAPTSGPEWDIQTATQRLLESDGWFVKNTNGNIFQYGFPDQYATHKKYGRRWIEYKNPKSYAFTPAQMDVFPQMQVAGVGIWILNDPSQTDLLFKPPNWRSFL